jgi:ParB-like chromosome segregation protein Spo0J
MSKAVHHPALGFEPSSLRIPMDLIKPLRAVTERVKTTSKYVQIAASVREVGLIEPPVVSRSKLIDDTYYLLDGHLRVEILKEQGITAVVCLIATDDEAYTYNKRVNRLAIIQEHNMIITAIEKGVPEERLARALNLNISQIRSRFRLLRGICPEVVNLLRDKHVPINVFTELRRMKPMRQIETAELMVAMDNYSASYARSLVAATPESQLVEKKKLRKGMTAEQVARMEIESANLEREFKVVEQDYGADHLDLVLAMGYVTRLLGNARVVRYLAKFHPEILTEFQKISEVRDAA